MARGGARKDPKLRKLPKVGKIQRALDHIRKLPNIGSFEDADARRAFSKGSVPPPSPDQLPAADSFAEGAKAVFAEHVERTKTRLLLDLHDVCVRTRGIVRMVVFQVNARCPPDLAQIVGGHAIVRAPLRAFLGEMRRRHPGVTMKIALAFDPADTGRSTEASLKVALKVAGATDLIKALRL